MDVKARLKSLMVERNWSYYRLAKESGVSWSTIRNMFARGTEPTVPTLEAICNGLGISLAQLLLGGHPPELTPEQSELLRAWGALGAREQELLLELAKALGRD